MISFDAAIALIGSVAKPLGTENVSLAQAFRRVLAAPVVARIDSPRRDVSSMDGYAVREEDLAQLPARLNIIGQSFAGAGWDGVVTSGTCTRIFTGAPLPDGANHIVIQENVERQGDLAIIDRHSGGSAYIRTRGSDFRADDELLARGRRLDPQALVAAAGADTGSVEVFLRPRVRIVSTGNELTEPGTARSSPQAVPDSVSLGVAALAETYGALCVDRLRLRDELALLQSAARAALKDVDLLVVTGGASVGERDFAKEMFAPLGLQIIFSMVSMKPGKPVWLGHVEGQFVIGLPGNPTSAMVTARLLLAPLLVALQGRDFETVLGWRAAPLGTRLPPCGARDTFHRAIIRNGAVDVLSFDHSSAQKALAEATVIVRQAAHSPALENGAIVPVLDL
jgi:molybdopterin molybdotransferase